MICLSVLLRGSIAEKMKLFFLDKNGNKFPGMLQSSALLTLIEFIISGVTLSLNLNEKFEKDREVFLKLINIKYA